MKPKTSWKTQAYSVKALCRCHKNRWQTPLKNNSFTQTKKIALLIGTTVLKSFSIAHAFLTAENPFEPPWVAASSVLQWGIFLTSDPSFWYEPKRLYTHFFQWCGHQNNPTNPNKTNNHFPTLPQYTTFHCPSVWALVLVIRISRKQEVFGCNYCKRL